MLNPASAIASKATIKANFVTTSERPGTTPSSTRERRSNGVATTRIASTITVPMNITRYLRYGAAKLKILFNVPDFNFWCLTDWSELIDLKAIHWPCIDTN